jgi:AraC-like DNA-binding protein
MEKGTILSIVVPSFPTFVESNKAHYTIGQAHPNRNHLPYFDLIFVVSGTLYLTENDIPFTIRSGEMIILCPNRHHFATKPCDEETDFYWLHFYYDGIWQESTEMLTLNSNIPIPNLHYHNEDYTMHLRKQKKITNLSFILESLHKLWDNTQSQSTSTAFWDNQILFVQLLKYLDESSNSQSSMNMLAQQIELYIKKNYAENLTNEKFSSEFHFHENHLIRCMKKTFNCTPLEYLVNYRLEKAATLLIRTDDSVADISAKVGLQNPAYFSLCFKKKFKFSPLKYRKLHTNFM